MILELLVHFVFADVTRDAVTIYARTQPIALAPVVVEAERSSALDRFESVAQTSTVTLEPADITMTDATSANLLITNSKLLAVS